MVLQAKEVAASVTGNQWADDFVAARPQAHDQVRLANPAWLPRACGG